MTPLSSFKDAILAPPGLINDHKVPIPPSSSNCPFTIRPLNPSTYLIREDDEYGEFPHIYAKLCHSPGSPASVIALSDTGCGTSLPNRIFPAHGPEQWNLRTFLEYMLNPAGSIPYLVITTHCHYDHILGIQFLPKTCSSKEGCECICSAEFGFDRSTGASTTVSLPTTILSSSHDPSFITPYSHLKRHSLCPTVSRTTPHYAVGIWAHDMQRVIYTESSSCPSHSLSAKQSEVSIDTAITILHTPGHTPDSLTWYDSAERHISVGDSLYERESPDSRDEAGADKEKRSWGMEPAMPTIFNNDSCLSDWWGSLGRVIAFVAEKDNEIEDEVHEQAEEEQEDDDWILVQPYPFPSPLKRRSGAFEQAHSQSKHQPLHAPTKRKPPLTLSAAHVTASVPALDCLLAMRTFMARILRDEVPFRELDEPEGGRRVGMWDDTFGGENADKKGGRFSVRAPLWVIEEGRQRIPKTQWGKEV